MKTLKNRAYRDLILVLNLWGKRGIKPKIRHKSGRKGGAV